MTLNPGYGIGISSKQRHKRHQRHYRHTRAARGSGDSPEMRLWISKRYASKTRLPPPKKNDSTQPRCSYKFVYPQSESPVIHPKILTRKSESLLIHSFR